MGEEIILDEATQQLQAELDTKLGRLILSRGELSPDKISSALDGLDHVRTTLDQKYAFQVTMAHVDGLEQALKATTDIKTQPTSEGFQQVFSVLLEKARLEHPKGVFFTLAISAANRPDRIGVSADMQTGLGTELPLDRLRDIKIIPRPITPTL